MCNNYQHFGCVFFCDISSLFPLHPYPVKAIGDQWRLKVTNHPSCPILCPPICLPYPLPSQTFLTLTQAVASRGSGVSFIFAPVEVLQGSEATEGNYSSALIGIIILAGWQRWITRANQALVLWGVNRVETSLGWWSGFLFFLVALFQNKQGDMKRKRNKRMKNKSYMLHRKNVLELYWLVQLYQDCIF